jgi:hypothetical protein
MRSDLVLMNYPQKLSDCRLGEGRGEADDCPASRPSDACSFCVAEGRRLGGQFEDQVDRRLRGAPQLGKPGFPRHLAQALFARLRTKAEPDLLR